MSGCEALLDGAYPEAASQWAAALPEGRRRDRVISALSAQWARKNPQQAGDYVFRLPPGKAQEEAAISVVSAWADRDPTRLGRSIRTERWRYTEWDEGRAGAELI